MTYEQAHCTMSTHYFRRVAAQTTELCTAVANKAPSVLTRTERLADARRCVLEGSLVAVGLAAVCLWLGSRVFLMEYAWVPSPSDQVTLPHVSR
jgi:hypothetical protein